MTLIVGRLCHFAFDIDQPASDNRPYSTVWTGRTVPYGKTLSNRSTRRSRQPTRTPMQASADEIAMTTERKPRTNSTATTGSKRPSESPPTRAFPACASRCWQRISASPRAVSTGTSKDRQDLLDAAYLQVWKEGRLRDIEKQATAAPGKELEQIHHVIDVYSAVRNRKGISIELSRCATGHGTTPGSARWSRRSTPTASNARASSSLDWASRR